MKPIYKPSGAAGEYGDLAINIYTGCNHGCYYCFAPSVLRKSKETFANVEPRKNIVEEVKRQLEREKVTGKLIHLCFTCDPYPSPPVDTTPTREIIKAIKESGNHVQILTKNGKDAMRDFDLLDGGDRFGITYAGYNGFSHDASYTPEEEPCAGTPHDRLLALREAHEHGIFTWVSCEPVLNDVDVLNFISLADYVDHWKIGKLNYHPSAIDWADFGHRAEATCRSCGRDYYIKDSLRAEMNKEG